MDNLCNSRELVLLAYKEKVVIYGGAITHQHGVPNQVVHREIKLKKGQENMH